MVRDWALTKDDGQDWESFWKVEEEKRAWTAPELQGQEIGGPGSGCRVGVEGRKRDTGVGWVQCAVLRCGIGPGMVPVGLQRAFPHR